jgi:hypothetical protein
VSKLSALLSSKCGNGIRPAMEGGGVCCERLTALSFPPLSAGTVDPSPP